MTKDWLNKEFDMSCQGEVEEIMDNMKTYKLAIPIIIFDSILFIIYAYLWVLNGFSIVGTILISIWFIWVYLSYKRFDGVDPTYKELIKAFPIFFPLLLTFTIYRRYLIKHYPNTNDPEEIKQFNRRKKIKSIL